MDETVPSPSDQEKEASLLDTNHDHTSQDVVPEELSDNRMSRDRGKASYRQKYKRAWEIDLALRGKCELVVK